MKIKIKIDKNGKIRKVRCNGSTGLARAAVQTIVDKPGRYAIKQTKSSLFFGALKRGVFRIGYIFIATVKAFCIACQTAGSLEDVPRHQSEG